MSDSWKASVMTVAGKPVVALDVNIKRSLLVNPEDFLLMIEALENAGLKAAKTFIEAAHDVPEDIRTFVVVPVTQVDNVKINLEPFGKIVDVFNDRNFVRVTGDATLGFEGIANIGGIEKFVDMSRTNLPSLNRQLDDERTKAKDAATRGEITREQAEIIDAYCKAFGDRSVGCESLYAAHEQMLKEKTAPERERQRLELEAHERDNRGRATEHRGSIGDKVTGFATNRF
ncbi:MAG TPA: hypothetical protein VM715_11875 [Candidatus Acidoferrum sp.]|nr:hypothetical protein [Candidatus Acidoferrum sp.]